MKTINILLKTISILLIVTGICLFCNIVVIKNNVAEPMLSQFALLCIVIGSISCAILFGRKKTIKKDIYFYLKKEKNRKIKMKIFFSLAIIPACLALINVGGEELGKINYWPIGCLAATILFAAIGVNYTKNFYE